VVIMTVQRVEQTDWAGTTKVLDGDFHDWSAIREWGRNIAHELTPVSR
jgi:hypothetical protein